MNKEKNDKITSLQNFITNKQVAFSVNEINALVNELEGLKEEEKTKK